MVSPFGAIRKHANFEALVPGLVLPLTLSAVSPNRVGQM